MPRFENPFRPGAGHKPPYLAGRAKEKNEFAKLLEQSVILENLVLTGLRGVGKTVLVDELKPAALAADWVWVGTDLSESSSLTEERLATRLITDLSVATSGWIVDKAVVHGVGFVATDRFVDVRLSHDLLTAVYQRTPGLVADKIKAVLEVVWGSWPGNKRGLIFVYDEAQNMADHVAKDEFPLSLMLDAFQSIQRKGIPFMLVLVGLPTLFPKLVEARTFAERMFRVVFLDRLGTNDCRDAILKPIESTQCPIRLGHDSITGVIDLSAGYPYFIQFICREVYDAFVQGSHTVPVEEISRKLDSDFFAGRWARATDRQRDLLRVIAHLDLSDGEFTVAEAVEMSKELLDKPFSSSHVNQMLVTLANNGLIYKNRHGRYSLAVPLLDRFILRQES